jgi:hypothetical protein
MTDGGDLKIDLRAPRATPAEIGMKPDAFGATASDPVKIDATAHAERKAGAWSGSGSVTIEAFHAPNAKPAPLAFEGAIAGPGGAALDLQRGKLSLGAGDALLGGTITILDDGVVAKLATTPSIQCDAGYVSRPAPLTISIDSRDLGAASIAPATKLCTPRTK